MWRLRKESDVKLTYHAIGDLMVEYDFDEACRLKADMEEKIRSYEYAIQHIQQQEQIYSEVRDEIVEYIAAVLEEAKIMVEKFKQVKIQIT